VRAKANLWRLNNNLMSLGKSPIIRNQIFIRGLKIVTQLKQVS
jgi:hypothetical protein